MGRVTKGFIMEKTNAARILDKAHITYSTVLYETDDDLSAQHIAEINGFDIQSLYKTLVLKGDKTGPIVALLRGDKSLNVKKLALLSGNKRCEMVPSKDLLTLTGYIRGGCSPIGMKKPFPTFIDKDALMHEQVFVNAGKKGIQLKLAPSDLIGATNAIIGNICEEK
jgi:Cys-tRNA(Pro)/Cys-tRNA(Cys) deacylase